MEGGQKGPGAERQEDPLEVLQFRCQQGRMFWMGREASGTTN